VSNFDETTVLRSHDRRVLMGPEVINGTGEVHLIADQIPILTNAQARELAAALIEAADYAEAVRREKEQPVQWPPGTVPDADFPPGSVHAYMWNDPTWRTAGKPNEEQAK
jgi:hypothetical protein